MTHRAGAVAMLRVPVSSFSARAALAPESAYVPLPEARGSALHNRFVGDHVLYYAVDHSPSYLWGSATWDNSAATIPFLRTVLEGGGSWDADETIRRAIEIREGVVVNPAILAFQGRDAAYPHPQG